MKFTKTLALSLLTLGAMQFAMAEEKKPISLNNEYPDAGDVILNGFKKGDVLKLLISECIGCDLTKYAYKANDVTYATVEKTKPEGMAGMKNTLMGGSKVVEFKVTFKDIPTQEDPLIIKNEETTYTIHFNKPTHTLNFTKNRGNITYPDTEKGENAQLKVGELIDLVFTENRTVSSTEKREIKALPKYLDFIGERFDAPSMDSVGGPGMHHMFFLVKEQPKLLGERLRLKFGDKQLNIKFVIAKSEAAPK